MAILIATRLWRTSHSIALWCHRLLLRHHWSVRITYASAQMKWSPRTVHQQGRWTSVPVNKVPTWKRKPYRRCTVIICSGNYNTLIALDASKCSAFLKLGRFLIHRFKKLCLYTHSLYRLAHMFRALVEALIQIMLLCVFFKVKFVKTRQLRLKSASQPWNTLTREIHLVTTWLSQIKLSFDPTI